MHHRLAAGSKLPYSKEAMVANIQGSRLHPRVIGIYHELLPPEKYRDLDSTHG
jgi:hypothetical protein